MALIRHFQYDGDYTDTAGVVAAGTPTGDPVFGDAIFQPAAGGQSLVLNGSSQYVAHGTRPAATTGMTIAAWIHPTSITSSIGEGIGRTIASVYNTDTTERMFALAVSEGSSGPGSLNMALGAEADGTYVGTWGTADNALAVNETQHVAVVYDAGALTFLIDGVEVANSLRNGSGSIPTSLFPGTQPLRVGIVFVSGSAESGGYFAGRIDDLPIYDVADVMLVRDHWLDGGGQSLTSIIGRYDSNTAISRIVNRHGDDLYALLIPDADGVQVVYDIKRLWHSVVVNGGEIVTSSPLDAAYPGLPKGAARLDGGTEMIVPGDMADFRGALNDNEAFSGAAVVRPGALNFNLLAFGNSSIQVLSGGNVGVTLSDGVDSISMATAPVIEANKSYHLQWNVTPTVGERWIKVNGQTIPLTTNTGSTWPTFGTSGDVEIGDGLDGDIKHVVLAADSTTEDEAFADFAFARQDDDKLTPNLRLDLK